MEDKQIIPKLDMLRLQKKFEIAGLPITNVRIEKDLTINWDWTVVPTEKQNQQAAEIMAEHNPEDKTIEPAETIEKLIERKIKESEVTAEPITK